MTADLTVKGALGGTCGVGVVYHALTPVATLPVLEVLSGAHIVSDLILNLGTVVHDYLVT